MQVRPGEYLPIVRQLEDPQDANTYYVRAYVYKHKGGTESLIATLNLTDQGSQRFTYEYETPLDASGEGYFLTILTRVFTDSGYTTESPLYGRTIEDHLVDERWGLRFGTGGGADIDYKRLRNIVKEEVEKLPKAKALKPIDLSPLLRTLEDVNEGIRNIKMPELEKVDFTPLVRAMEKVEAEVRKIKIPEPEKLDLSPILNFLRKIEEQRDVKWKIFGEDYEKFAKHLKSFTDRLTKGFLIKMPAGEEEKPKKRRIFI